ncbi:MAG: hypothetical protein WDW36_001465 [Sanguina aurantia]
MESAEHWESPQTKRRLHSLLAVSGILDQLTSLKPRHATFEELARVHAPEYIHLVRELSADDTKGLHTCGDGATFSPGGYEIAALSAGGAIVALESVMSGAVSNAYVLTRPPGHHAEKAEGMGFCIFNNIAVAAAHAIEKYGLKRVAIIDYDVHHGNGTQHLFEDSDQVMFISIHQDSNYPVYSGYVSETGTGAGAGFTINVPLPPGSGSGAYKDAFQRVVIPALEAFEPELILVSSGFDAAYMDPLGSMMLSSLDFGAFAAQLVGMAGKLCDGKILFLHEGGYSEIYVPFCGLAVLEAMSGISTGVVDPWLHEVAHWGYQALQPHQALVVDKSVAVVELLREKVATASSASSSSAAAAVAAGSSSSAPPPPESTASPAVPSPTPSAAANPTPSSTPAATSDTPPATPAPQPAAATKDNAATVPAAPRGLGAGMQKALPRRTPRPASAAAAAAAAAAQPPPANILQMLSGLASAAHTSGSHGSAPSEILGGGPPDGNVIDLAGHVGGDGRGNGGGGGGAVASPLGDMSGLAQMMSGMLGGGGGSGGAGGGGGLGG